MTPVHRDPQFPFRFAEDRFVSWFHLDGVAPGCQVTVYRLDPATGGRLGLIATAAAGEGGWVDLPEPLVVRAGG